jgi:CheY-like chemotaxis protein
MVSRSLDDASPQASRAPPILVIDDDAAAAATTIAALAEGRYRGTAESDGDAALRHVRTVLVGLVVSELYVACAEGPCVITVLKAERTRLPRLQVLVYTRHDDPADREWALATGCDALLLKSAPSAMLLREVGRLDGGTQPAREGLRP